MYGIKNYLDRGLLFLNNNTFPKRKKLATLMLYVTDMCDSRCMHCYVWKKKPKVNMPKEKVIEILQSKIVTKNTLVGLEGGEFLLHPEAMEMLEWLSKNHPNFDLLTNGLQPDRVIDAVQKYPPKRLYISLDGNKETYKRMRGKDGFDKVMYLIEQTKNKAPVSLMFTLTPFNSYQDMEFVGEIAKLNNLDMRIGIYNNMAFFDTNTDAHVYDDINQTRPNNIPGIAKEFPENYDFLALYHEWKNQNLRLNCYSILDSLVILPNGDIPICQNLDVKIGNVYDEPLEKIFTKPETIQLHKKYVKNCNQCWINFHRKYDVVLYRNLEKFLGKGLIEMILGKYQWCQNPKLTYKQYLKQFD